MILGDKDPKDFLVGFECMIHYPQDLQNRQQAEMELNLRGVKAMIFYDIALGFVILEAFQDLDKPPGCHGRHPKQILLDKFQGNSAVDRNLVGDQGQETNAEVQRRFHGVFLPDFRANLAISRNVLYPCKI
jgi:hypothetical protein